MVAVNPANDPFDEPLQANSGNPSGQIDVSQIIRQLFVLGQEIEGLKAAQARNESEVGHLQVEVYKPRH